MVCCLLVFAVCRVMLHFVVCCVCVFYSLYDVGCVAFLVLLIIACLSIVFDCCLFMLVVPCVSLLFVRCVLIVDC